MAGSQSSPFKVAPSLSAFQGYMHGLRQQHGSPLSSSHLSSRMRSTPCDFPAPHILNTTKLTAWRARRGSSVCSPSTGTTDLRMQWVSRRKFPLGFPKQPQSKVPVTRLIRSSDTLDCLQSCERSPALWFLKNPIHGPSLG